ncbi:MAG: hypothetical protein AAF604_22520 [Acidobacteriota bacterium]
MVEDSAPLLANAETAPREGAWRLAEGRLLVGARGRIAARPRSPTGAVCSFDDALRLGDEILALEPFSVAERWRRGGVELDKNQSEMPIDFSNERLSFSRREE